MLDPEDGHIICVLSCSCRWLSYSFNRGLALHSFSRNVLRTRKRTTITHHYHSLSRIQKHQSNPWATVPSAWRRFMQRIPSRCRTLLLVYSRRSEEGKAIVWHHVIICSTQIVLKSGLLSRISALSAADRSHPSSTLRVPCIPRLPSTDMLICLYKLVCTVLQHTYDRITSHLITLAKFRLADPLRR